MLFGVDTASDTSELSNMIPQAVRRVKVALGMYNNNL